MDNRALLKELCKQIIFKRNFRNAFKILFDRIKGMYELSKYSNELVVVGIAPYDSLMLKYKQIFKKHQTFYFTSSTIWLEKRLIERGKIENKNEYIEILKNSFQGIACVSNETKRQLIELNIDLPMVVVGHSIYTKKYNKKISKNDVTKFIFIGQINKRKNIPLLVKWISSSNNNFIFDFAGPIIKSENKVWDNLKSLIKSDERINYLGKLSKKQITSNICNYDFLVLPSLEEKFGIVIIEALASGVPCIVSNTIGPIEIIEDGMNGFIFDLQKYESFEEKMNIAINISRENYSEMSKNAELRSVDFDIDSVKNSWNNLLFLNEIN